MARTVNHSQQFSACSIAQMQPWLVAPCLDALAAGDVEVRFANAPPDAMMGEEFEVEVVVDNPSSSDAHGIEVTAAGSDLTVRQMTAASAEGFACQASASGPCVGAPCCQAEARRGPRVLATTTTSGPATLQVTVRAINDANTSNNIASHALAARPFVAMSVGFSPGPTVVRVGEAFEYVVTLRNAGNITGTNAIGRVILWPGSLNIVVFSSDIGSCTPFTTGNTTVLGTPPPGYAFLVAPLSRGRLHPSACPAGRIHGNWVLDRRVCVS